MTVNIIMPEMGEGIIEGTVARWLKQVGETVERDEPLLEIETDKVTTEAAAEASGILTEILIEEGETVAVGTILGVIGQTVPEAVPSGQPTAPSAAPPKPKQPILETVELDLSTRETNGSIGRYTRQSDVGWVSPVVARMAAEHSLDLTEIKGTGKKRPDYETGRFKLSGNSRPRRNNQWPTVNGQ